MSMSDDKRITVTVQGQPIRSVVFLDKHCLNPGEDWQAGFLRGVRQSLLIVIHVLVSAHAMMNGIIHIRSILDPY